MTICSSERFETTMRPDGRYSQRCRFCPATRITPHERYSRPCYLAEPDHGGGYPGSELTSLLKELGVGEFSGCGCAAKARQMNAWGVGGCRKHRETIICWLRDNVAKLKWFDRLRIVLKGFSTGLAMKLNLRDPIAALVDLAIERAAANQGQGPRRAGRRSGAGRVANLSRG